MTERGPAADDRVGSGARLGTRNGADGRGPATKSVKRASVFTDEDGKDLMAQAFREQNPADWIRAGSAKRV